MLPSDDVVTIAALAVAAAALPPADVRAMIHDARHIVEQSGDRVWPGFSRTPLPVELVDPANEFVFGDAPLPGFVALGTDPVTGCSVQTRPRDLPVDVSAADDLAGHQVVQVGLPEALHATRGEWTVLLLHESFHQYQATLPDHARAVAAVRRRLGQPGGSWALDYPFPYARPQVVAAFAAMDARALAFLAAAPGDDVRPVVAAYVVARGAAEAVVGETDWQYYEFEAGEEGVARWTELTLAAAGATDPEIAAVALDRRGGLATALRVIGKQGLGAWRRSAFYVFGAVEAAMLDRVSPNWRAAYRRTPFALGGQLAAAVH